MSRLIRTMNGLWVPSRRVRIARGIRATSMNPNIDQTGFQFFEDGAEATSTAVDSEDVDISYDVDTILQVRFAVENNGTGGLNNYLPELQYRYDAGSWLDCDGVNTEVVPALGAMTDDEVTTERLAAGAGSWTQGRVDEVDGQMTTSTNLGVDEYTQHAWSVQIVGTEVEATKIVDFRCVAVVSAPGPEVPANWTQTDEFLASVTITVPGAAPRVPKRHQYNDQLHAA